MDRLTFFGLLAVSAMLVCYALEHRSHWYIFAFAVSCAMGSAYGFLQGGVALRTGRSRVVDRCASTVVGGSPTRSAGQRK